MNEEQLRDLVKSVGGPFGGRLGYLDNDAVAKFLTEPDVDPKIRYLALALLQTRLWLLDGDRLLAKK